MKKYVLILIFLAFAVAVIMPSFAVWSSPTAQFNVAPDTVYINWTNASGLGAYSTNITITINDNQTVWATISIDNTTPLYFNYTSTPYTCGATYNCAYLYVRNENGLYTNVTKNMSGGNSTNITLERNMAQPLIAGKYRGSMRVYNTTNSSETVNVTVILDVPIAVNSSLFGSFSGTLPINGSAYHNFYFNTSNITNATGVLINISGWSATQNVDLFLFDNNGNLKEKSINNTDTSESLLYNFLPAAEIWEIRVFGNSSSAISYVGTVFFTTLNATDAANPGVQNTTIDLGTINTTDISQMTPQRTILLKNEGVLNITSVSESKELYNINKTTTSGARNFTFVVPDYITKVKASLNWTGGSNYSFLLYKPDGTLVADSMGKYVYANISRAMQEEYNETVATAADKGIWRIDVRNNTNETATYTLTIYQYVNETRWISSNYTTSRFNMTGLNNSNSGIQINFTVPNNTIAGAYEGSLKYLDGSGIGIKIPIKFTLNSSVLLVNGTFNSTSLRIDENINVTLDRSVSVIINNTGTYDINNIVATNSTRLNHTTSSGYHINFTSIQVPAILAAGASSIINITVRIYSNITNDTVGVYEGWVLLNASNSSYAVKPYDIFNITVRVNLTNLLDVRVTGLDTSDTPSTWIYNSSAAKDIRLQYLNVYYINGTQIKGTSIIFGDNTNFDLSNITSVRLYQRNASYYSPNSTGSLVKTKLTQIEPSAGSGNYWFNFTVPANVPGGKYDVKANVTTLNGKLYGVSGDTILTIAGEGLYINTSSGTSPSASINTGLTTTLTAYVYNFGPNASAALNIYFDKGACTYINVTTVNASVSAVPAYTYGSAYTASWTVGAVSAGICTVNVWGTNENWYNNLSYSVTVSGTTATPTTPPPGPGVPGVNVTTNVTPQLTITSYPTETKIQQNASKAVEVKVNNSGYANLTGVRVYVDGIPLWYEVPSAQDIAKAVEKTYSITFNIPANAEIKTYAIKFVANNSQTSASASSSLIVLPSNETQRQIALNVTNYTSKVEAISKAINETKAKGGNTSVAEEKLKQAQALISQANAYITLGDYNSAYALLGQIDALLKDAEAKLLEVKTQLEQQAGSFWLWVAVGIAIAVGLGFLVYMLIPPPHGYEPEVGFKYAPPEARGKPKLEQLKERIRGLVEKIKSKFKKKEQAAGYQTYQYGQ